MGVYRLAQTQWVFVDKRKSTVFMATASNGGGWWQAAHQVLSTQRSTIATASSAAMLAAQMPAIQIRRLHRGGSGSLECDAVMAGQRNRWDFMRDIHLL